MRYTEYSCIVDFPILDVLSFVQDLHVIDRTPEPLKRLQEECSHILKAEYNIATH